MVKIMENPMNKWMIWGFSHIFSNTHFAKGVLEVIVMRSFKEVFEKIIVTIRAGSQVCTLSWQGFSERVSHQVFK